VILFQSDWVNKHPTAIPHYSTTNKSWVRLAGVLNKMGVENCLFHLALHNPALKDIDPHSPDLTTEQIAMVVEEASENPWYMLREVIRVPPIAGIDSVPLRANRGNISLYFLFFCHVTTLLQQVRQSGKSLSVDALMVSLLTTLTVNTDIQLLTKDDALRVKNVTRLKDLISCLPPYLQLRSRKDTNNTEKITINSLGNVYQSAVAQSSDKAALKLGRGMTTPIIHIDEIAFINNIDVTLPAMLASGSAARDMAKEVGAPYGYLFTTTPGYLASKSGAYAYEIYQESFRWSELFFDTDNEDDLREKIKLNSPGNKVQVVLDYNHRQLGYTDEWLREKISDARATGDAALTDFLCIWANSNANTIIPADKLKILMASKTPECETYVSSHGFIIKLYITLEDFKTRQIVAGLDTSEGVGADEIALVLRDASDGSVVGTGTYNSLNTHAFAQWIASLLIDYPNILLLIERKNTGVTILDIIIEVLLAKGVDPFSRLFNFVVNDSEEKEIYVKEVINIPFRRRDPNVYIKYRKYFGYTTTGAGRTSRGMLYGEIFNDSIAYTCNSVYDSKLINELSGLRERNGRIDHGDKDHDDMVIAWLLAYYVLSKGKNLSFYGLTETRVLAKVTEQVIEEQGGQAAVDHKQEQLCLRADILDIVELLKVEPNRTRVKMLTARLKHLYEEIDSNVLPDLNLSNLLRGIELENTAYSSNNQVNRFCNNRWHR